MESSGNFVTRCSRNEFEHLLQTSTLKEASPVDRKKCFNNPPHLGNGAR